MRAPPNSPGRARPWKRLCARAADQRRGAWHAHRAGRRVGTARPRSSPTPGIRAFYLQRHDPDHCAGQQRRRAACPPRTGCRWRRHASRPGRPPDRHPVGSAGRSQPARRRQAGGRLGPVAFGPVTHGIARARAVVAWARTLSARGRRAQAGGRDGCQRWEGGWVVLRGGGRGWRPQPWPRQPPTCGLQKNNALSGTVFTAAVAVLAAVASFPVLAMPWATATMGWPGLAVLAASGAATGTWGVGLMAGATEVGGQRYGTYREVAEAALGERWDAEGGMWRGAGGRRRRVGGPAALRCASGRGRGGGSGDQVLGPRSHPSPSPPSPSQVRGRGGW